MGAVAPPETSPRRSRRKLWLILGGVAALLVLCFAGVTVIGLFVPTASGRSLVEPPPAVAPTVASPASPATSPSAQPSTSAAPVPSATPEPAAPPAPATTPSIQEGSVACRFTAASGGVYFLLVTSYDEHNYHACDGGAWVSPIETVLNMPDMDARCTLGLDYVARMHAVVGVYSDTAAPNLAAARAFCDANGGVQ